MNKITKKAALIYHSTGKPGKIEIKPTKQYSTQTDLSLAYSPGVAEPCLEIEKNPLNAYKYTAKGNLVAVISNGTAVLGLGDIGAVAGKPVMEGKALLFKIYAGIDVFDIEIDEKNPEKFIEIVKSIAPTFGGINLEDIKAPECFEIERKLKQELSIPIMHDDQHGTAIISAAGLINALEIVGKKIENVKVVVSGAGAGAISSTSLYMELGVKKENIVMIDSSGVIRQDRKKLSALKKKFATQRTDINTLKDAIVDADVFLGLSKGNILNKNMVRTMAKNPIVFALANPNPEISYENAKAARKDVLISTGRSDYPNQINNVIGFPYIFRGALDTNATTINQEMKLAAVYAIAKLAKEPVPDVVNTAYKVDNLSFGVDYYIPKPIDPRLITEVSVAVAKAAMKSGVARKNIENWDEYKKKLKELMGQESKLIQQIYDTAKQNPKKVVFAETTNPNILKAAVQTKNEGLCYPILLGNQEEIKKLAQKLNLNIKGIKIIAPNSDKETSQREKYAEILTQKKQQREINTQKTINNMSQYNYFGMMMVENGDADAFITGIHTKYPSTIQIAKEIIGIKPQYNHFATMHILNSKKGTYFVADTLINRNPNTQTLIDIAQLAQNTVKLFNHNPVVAMLSFSNFGADCDSNTKMVHNAVEYMHQHYPELPLDGEMQVNFALDQQLRDSKFPFTKLKGLNVNTLIFPNLSSANSTYKFIQSLSETEVIGPIQMGLNKPIHFTDIESTVKDIVTITAVAVIDAMVSKK